MLRGSHSKPLLNSIKIGVARYGLHSQTFYADGSRIAINLSCLSMAVKKKLNLISTFIYLNSTDPSTEIRVSGIIVGNGLAQGPRTPAQTSPSTSLCCRRPTLYHQATSKLKQLTIVDLIHNGSNNRWCRLFHWPKLNQTFLAITCISIQPNIHLL